MGHHAGRARRRLRSDQLARRLQHAPNRVRGCGRVGVDHGRVRRAGESRRGSTELLRRRVARAFDVDRSDLPASRHGFRVRRDHSADLLHRGRRVSRPRRSAIAVWHRFATGARRRLAVLRARCVYCPPCPAKQPSKNAKPGEPAASQTRPRPSALLDTRIIYCGDCLDRLAKLPDRCVDLIYIDPPFNSNRNYEVFWGETKEKRAFEDRHASTQRVYHVLGR